MDVDRPPFADARRSFVSALAVTLLRPRVVHAQEHRIYRIAMLEAVPAARNAANLAALRRGLREHGYVEGRNLVIDYRSADGHADRFPELAAEVVRLGVDLIIARGTPATSAAKRATQTVPVVMATMGDAHALVASFAHPGGNVTGLTTFSTELSAKRIELLAELVPHLRHVGLLHDMANSAARPEWEETRKAAKALGLDAELFDARDAAGVERAFTHARRSAIDALVVGADGLTQLQLHRIVALANEAHMPAAYPGRDFVEAGGLIAYGVDYPDLYYRFASYVDRILEGARPGDLPVEQPARFELVINAGTARKLGLIVPASLRLRANEVIE
ncbi:MAG TPA: ABC transporter substrate-binding protein [Casimicrobiaceae bacterium]